MPPARLGAERGKVSLVQFGLAGVRGKVSDFKLPRAALRVVGTREGTHEAGSHQCGNVLIPDGASGYGFVGNGSLIPVRLPSDLTTNLDDLLVVGYVLEAADDRRTLVLVVIDELDNGRILIRESKAPGHRQILTAGPVGDVQSLRVLVQHTLYPLS